MLSFPKKDAPDVRIPYISTNRYKNPPPLVGDLSKTRGEFLYQGEFLSLFVLMNGWWLAQNQVVASLAVRRSSRGSSAHHKFILTSLYISFINVKENQAKSRKIPDFLESPY